MRIAALVIGIIGAMAGFIGGLIALVAGGIAGAFGAESAGTVEGLGLAGIGFSVVGLVGAALAIAKPKVAAILMVISAVGGIISIFVAYILAALLLGIAALLAFLGRNKRVPAPPQT
ncbi:MAG: hypothetical protein V1724_10195 [Chloroflexota bacterium]